MSNIRDTKGRIVKETFPSEIVSIMGDIFAGIALTFLILPFKSFLILILIIPALLSLRGNLSGPFIARTSRDMILGEFTKKAWVENALATIALSIIISLLVGFFTILLDFFFFQFFILPSSYLIFIPILSVLFTLFISIPCSTCLNYFAFKRGLNPNNIVNPIMTAIDDFSTVICFYITLLILGVP